MAGKSIALALIAAALAALGVLYVAFERGESRAASVTSPTASINPAATVATPPAVVLAPPVAAPTPPLPVPVRVAIDDPKPGTATPPIRATQGDAVTILLTSEKAGTVEVHGYGQSVAVKPGIETILAFRADHSGRFPIHLHTNDGGHLEVTALEVLPK